MGQLILLVVWLTMTDGSVNVGAHPQPQQSIEQCKTNGDEFVKSSGEVAQKNGIAAAHYICITLTPKESAQGVEDDKLEGSI